MTIDLAILMLSGATLIFSLTGMYIVCASSTPLSPSSLFNPREEQ